MASWARILSSVELVLKSRFSGSGGHFFSILLENNTNGGNYGDLVAGTCSRKKNHEAAASRQLAPTHVTAPDYDLLTSREKNNMQYSRNYEDRNLAYYGITTSEPHRNQYDKKRNELLT